MIETRTLEVVGSGSFEDRARALLARCRTALDPSGAEWEPDVGEAIELDAALVKDLDALLAT